MAVENNTPQEELSPDVKNWARNEFTNDPDFIRYLASHGNPLSKAIANLILDLNHTKGDKKKSATLER